MRRRGVRKPYVGYYTAPLTAGGGFWSCCTMYPPVWSGFLARTSSAWTPSCRSRTPWRSCGHLFETYMAMEYLFL